MSGTSAGKIGELLVSQGVITPEQLKKAMEHKNQNKTRLISSLIQLKHVNEKVLATFLSKQYGLPAISLDGITVPPELVKLIPPNLCEKHDLLPLSVEGNRLSIAISDPTNVTAVDDVRFISNMDVDVYLATESSIRQMIERTYNASGRELAEMIDPLKEDDRDTRASVVEVKAQTDDAKFDVDDDTKGEKPVIRLINKLFVEAIRRKASDIHIEPYETHSPRPFPNRRQPL